MATLVLDFVTIQNYVQNHSTEAQPLLELLELNAIGALEAMPPGRVIELDDAAVVRVIDSDNRRFVTLPTPIADGTTATVRERATIEAGYSAVAATSFESRFVPEFQTHELVRTDGALWPNGDATLEVTYRSGYSKGSVPRWIREALLMSIDFSYRARNNEDTDPVVTQGPKIPASASLIWSRHYDAVQRQRQPEFVALA